MHSYSINKIAFIGLGAMGLPMARNLLRAGYTLNIVPHRNRAPVEELCALGAAEYPTAAEAVSRSDALISILPEDRQLEEVLLSSKMLDAAREGMLLIEMTSGSPNVMRRIGEAYGAKRVKVLDAPVSGGTAGAQQGTLTVMAGGESSILEEAMPLLRSMAATIHSVGDIGAGKAVKAINQMLAAIHMLAASEALTVAEQLGIDLASLQKVISSSSGNSWMFANKLEAIAERQFAPGFKLDLMKKDIGIALAEGRGKPLPLTALSCQLYEMAARESGEMDFASVSRLVR